MKILRSSLLCFLVNFSMDFNSLRERRANTFGIELVTSTRKSPSVAVRILSQQRVVGALVENWYFELHILKRRQETINAFR